jgi:hypothetical protein
MFKVYLTLVLPLLANLQHCQATPTQEAPLAQRDLLSDLGNGLSEGVRDVLAHSILQRWWQDLPTGEQKVKDSFNIKNLDSLNGETEFLNIPGYANYTTAGWNARIRGQMYTLPYFNLPQSKKDDLAEDFLPGVDWNTLSATEKDNARNLTGHIYSIPKPGQDVTFHFKVAPQSPGSATGGQTWEQVVKFPYTTNSAGEVAGFLPLSDPNKQLPAGNGSGGVAGILDTWTKGIQSGNATTYLVPKEGITILSDIDDILRVTKIYIPKEGLYNSFARDFTPWLNMPSIYASWSTQNTNSSSGAQSSSPYHFHYLTTTPEQATRTYMDFIYSYYPLGSFDTRPLNFTTVAQTLNTRRELLYQIFQTFPQRRFVLVGDISNSDVLSEYPKLVQTFPGQVHCILMRNISKTDPKFHMPYNTAEFESLKSGQYMFFSTPDDLKGLNFANGDCVNHSVEQSTDFGWHNLPGDGDVIDSMGQGNRALSAKFSMPVMVLALIAGIMSAL